MASAHSGSTRAQLHTKGVGMIHLDEPFKSSISHLCRQLKRKIEKILTLVSFRELLRKIQGTRPYYWARVLLRRPTVSYYTRCCAREIRDYGPSRSFSRRMTVLTGRVRFFEFCFLFDVREREGGGGIGVIR